MRFLGLQGYITQGTRVTRALEFHLMANKTFLNITNCCRFDELDFLRLLEFADYFLINKSEKNFVPTEEVQIYLLLQTHSLFFCTCKCFMFRSFVFCTCLCFYFILFFFAHVSILYFFFVFKI